MSLPHPVSASPKLIPPLDAVPSRSCLLTGQYAQQTVSDITTPGNIPDYTRFLPECLKPLGYRSYHTGKWHMRHVTGEGGALEPNMWTKWNTPDAELVAKIGPGEVTRAVPWSSLTREQKKFQRAKLAIHVAMISRMDLETGKILKQIEAMGEFDNTVVIFLSDNGASWEQLIRGDGHDSSAPLGSAKTHLGIGPGWASCSNAPFRLHRSWVTEARSLSLHQLAPNAGRPCRRQTSHSLRAGAGRTKHRPRISEGWFANSRFSLLQPQEQSRHPREGLEADRDRRRRSLGTVRPVEGSFRAKKSGRRSDRLSG